MPSFVQSMGESDFTPIPAGTYVGRCYQVVNIGLQASGPWAPKNKHYIAFEVPSERITWKDKEQVEHEGPAIIGSRYTSSLSPKAILRQHLESWRGRRFTDDELANFDLFNLIGAPALISVVHSEDGKYANITALMRLPQGMVCPDAELPTIAYDPADPSAGQAFEALTKRMQDTVMKGQEVPPAPEAPAPAPSHSGVYTPQPMSESPVPGHMIHQQKMDQRPSPFRDHVTGADFDDDIPF